MMVVVRLGVVVPILLRPLARGVKYLENCRQSSCLLEQKSRHQLEVHLEAIRVESWKGCQKQTIFQWQRVNQEQWPIL